MKTDHDILFDELIRTTLAEAELQAPDLWPEIAAQVNPKGSRNWLESSTIRGIVTIVIVGTSIGYMLMNAQDSSSTDNSDHSIRISDNSLAADNRTHEDHETLTLKDHRDDVQEPKPSIQHTSSDHIQEATPEKTVALPVTSGEKKVKPTIPEDLPVPPVDHTEHKNQMGQENGEDLQAMDEHPVEILISNETPCIDDPCAIALVRNEWYDKVIWKIDQETVSENKSGFTFIPDHPGEVVLSVIAVKNGKKYGTARRITVKGARTHIGYTVLHDKVVRIHADKADIQRIAWNFGDRGEWQTSKDAALDHQYDRFGNYQVRASITTSDGCNDTVSTLVDLTKAISVLTNVITPGMQDGKNDFFEVEGEDISSYLITIRDYTGRIIYQSDQIERPWDGTDMLTGKTVQPGTYFYRIVYRQGNAPDQAQTGQITVR